MPRDAYHPVRVLLGAALLSCVLVAWAETATLAARPHASATYAQLLHEIAARQVRTAIINKKAHDVRVTLNAGQRELVIYPSHQERQLAARLRSAGAIVTLVRHRKPAVHHRLRYIVGAIILVGLLLWGLLRFARGRRGRPRSGRGAPRAGPPGATSDS